MARSKTFLIGLLLPFLAFGQETPVPTDIPYAVLVKSAQVDDPDGNRYSLDGGVCLNDAARDVQRKALDELRTSNDDLRKQLSAKDAEASANQLGAPAWVGIAASILGTIATAVTTVIVTSKK